MTNSKIKPIYLNSKVKQHGFTLIETLVSISILTIGILGLMRVVDSVIYYQSKSAEVTQATLLSTSMIEEIKRFSINEPSGGRYGFNYLVTDYLVDKKMTKINEKTYSFTEVINEGSKLPKMTRTVTLQTYPSGDEISFSAPGKINLLEVIIKTEWIDKRGNKKNVELGTLINKRYFVE
jgi:prepilin-type N-terminal cleavage/methylation domain-containing protein